MIYDYLETNITKGGHIERLPKQIMVWTPAENRKRDRRKVTWMAGIMKSRSERHLRPGHWNDEKD